MRMRISILLITLGLALSFFSLAKSGALSAVAANRPVSARVADDESAFFQLKGFNNTDNQISNNSTYKNIGSIKNNTRETLEVSITVRPVSLTTVKNWSASLKIGSTEVSFSKNDTAEKQFDLTVSSGSSLPVDVIFKTAGESITLSYQFKVMSASNTTVIHLADTSSTPRRQTLR